MSAIPYMPLYIADYLADAGHLTTIEHGAYLLLIMNYWQRGEALPCDDKRLARIARMSECEWIEARPQVSEFFEQNGAAWHHARIEKELAKFRAKSAQAAAAGRASGERRASARPTDVQRTFNGRSTRFERTSNHTDTDTEK